MNRAAEQLTFNLSEAIARKEQGIQQVADNNEHFLEVVRNIARSLAEAKYEITCDDVRKLCPIDPLHPNAWGAVFKTKEWEWTQKFRRSSLVQGHGNLQRVWRLRTTV